MDSLPRAVAPRDRFYARTFALITALVLGFALYSIVKPFLGPLLWALFLAFLLHPAHVQLTRRLRNRPQTSALILTLTILVLAIGPLTALSAAFATQVGDLLAFAQAAVADPTRVNVPNLANVPFLRDAVQWLDEKLGVTVTQLRGWAVEGGRQILQSIASLSGKIFLGAVGTVVGFVLMEFMLFFFLRDGAEMLAMMRELIPMAHAERTRLFDHLAAVTRAVVFGTCLTAAIQGTLVGIAFLIVGLPSPVVFGTIAALLSLLPVGGSAIVWVPAVLVLAADQRFGAAAFMLIWGALLVSLVDNVLRPFLVSGRAPVSTLTVFIGVLGGVAAFGTIGLFLGPVVIATIIALLRFMLEMRRAEKPAAPANEPAPSMISS